MLDIDPPCPSQVGLIAPSASITSTLQVPPHPGGAHPWAGRGGAGRDSGRGLGWDVMEAEPAPDLSMMLRELLAPSCLDPEPLPGPTTQQAPRTPRCFRPSGRCVKERPLPPTWPSGQGVMTSGSWGYSGVTMLVAGTYKEEILVPRGTWGHMWSEVMQLPLPHVPEAYVGAAQERG